MSKKLQLQTKQFSTLDLPELCSMKRLFTGLHVTSLDTLHLTSTDTLHLGVSVTACGLQRHTL